MKKYREFFTLIIFTLGLQALIYFLIKVFISDYNVINSKVNIPLIKEFVYIYNLWYLFVILVVFLIYKYSKNNFKSLILTMLLGAFLAHITFIIYPSMIKRPVVEVKNVTDWFLNFTYKVDTPAINCLPSMHCIYCFIIIFYALICKEIDYKKRIFIIIFSLLIVASTLFIKQHVIEDVVLALIYSIIVIFLAKLISKRVWKD